MKGSESLNKFIPLLETKEESHGESAYSEEGRSKPASSNIQLSQELEQELARITKEFTVDTAKLKDVVKHFGEELDDGLKKTHQNIVRWTDPHVVAKRPTKTKISGYVSNVGLWPTDRKRTGTVPYHRPGRNQSASMLDYVEGPAPGDGN